MIEYNRVELGKEAQKYGFVRDTFEKVLRLKEILKFFNSQEYLSEHLVLKGGTAINTVIFNLPRLSVDIDMDFMIKTLTSAEISAILDKSGKANVCRSISENVKSYKSKNYI